MLYFVIPHFLSIVVLEVDHISVVTMESRLRAVERAFERSGRYGLRPSDLSDETSTTHILLSCNQYYYELLKM